MTDQAAAPTPPFGWPTWGTPEEEGARAAKVKPGPRPSPYGPPLPASSLPRFEIVFFDMDDVLCEWMRIATPIHGKPLDRLTVAHNPEWKPGDGRNVYEILGITKWEFWSKIDELPNFWHDLPKSPVFDQLIANGRSLADSMQILTKPHQHENCFAGKHHWCRQHLPWMPLTLTEDKSLLAKPGRLLIDDRDENVDSFRAAGGSAILFPQHWNSAHDKAPFGPLFYLAQELEKLRIEQANMASWQEAPPPPLDSMGVQRINGFGETIPPIDPASQPSILPHIEQIRSGQTKQEMEDATWGIGR